MSRCRSRPRLHILGPITVEDFEDYCAETLREPIRSQERVGSEARISWSDAMLMAAWYGMRLPDQREVEKWSGAFRHHSGAYRPMWIADRERKSVSFSNGDKISTWYEEEEQRDTLTILVKDKGK